MYSVLVRPNKSKRYGQSESNTTPPGLVSKVMRTTHDVQTIEAMRMYGSAFVQALARAAERADDANLDRLRDAFPDLWQEYGEMAKAAR